MKGLLMVARREILVRGKSKSYIVGVLLMCVAVIALTLVPKLLGGGDSYTVGVTGKQSTELSAALSQAGKHSDLDITVKKYGDVDDVKKSIKDGKTDVGIVDNKTLLSEANPDQKLSVVLDAVHSTIALRGQLHDAGLNDSQVTKAMSVPALEENHLGGKDAEAKAIIAYILVIVLFFMVMMPTMYVAMGVVEEKSSRIVEILLSSLKTWQLLGGKILGLGVLGFINLAVPMSVGLLAGSATGSLSALPAGLIGYLLMALGWWVLGFAFYASMAGGLSSMVSRQEDMNSAIGPLTMLMVAGYVVASILVWTPTATATRVLSFIPPFSMLMMPVRSVVGDAAVWEQVLSAGILAAAVVGMLALGSTIYKRSVMRTGSKVKFSEIFTRTA
ncbi:MAG TPA: ABC transporter permease [Stackebrandtia sp.]|uniref:ABC transporter permease n=1 Tax=Stackebrandtia sp. TaxID=2023065 RepID=UPI002D42C637|nr:ABC transporter permease [Stackebrandtia sp.]HZE38325.1 ABC transporter permease [Stackebrandtia sp.]